MNKAMAYKGYHATFEYDDEYGIFVGKVHGISDSLNFHGTSVEELQMMFHQSIDNYLDFCEEVGKIPEKEYSGVFNVRVSPELHQKVAERAIQDGETINAIMKNALEEYFKKDNVKMITMVIPGVDKLPFDVTNYADGNRMVTRKENMQWTTQLQ